MITDDDFAYLASLSNEAQEEVKEAIAKILAKPAPPKPTASAAKPDTIPRPLPRRPATAFRASSR